MKRDLEEKQKENQKLKGKLIDFEKMNKINYDRKRSTILEKDQIKKSLNSMSKNLIEKEDKIRNLSTFYETLEEENKTLAKQLERLKKKEPLYDKKINEYKNKLHHYKKLKLMMEENELEKNEKIFKTQMELEENSKKQIERELEYIKKEIKNNDELAIFYLN